MKTKILGFVIFLFIQHNVLAQAAASDNYITQTGTLGSTYDWVDCSGGTSVFESGDDSQKTVAWPFNFRFYDNNYTTSDSFSIATNGFIRLDGNASTSYTAARNYDLTSTATQFGQIISVAIHDGNTNDNGSWIRYLVSGSSPNRVLTIEYNNLEIDYNDNRYADIQVSIYESTNRIVLKLGTDNLTKSGADMGLHSGVNNFFNKWQEVRSGTNNTWIEYTPPNVEINATTGTSLAYYATVKEAYDKINDGTHQGEINIKIHNNTTETASAKLNSSGSGSANYASINMYPTKTGLSITGNIPAPLIDLDGADNVTINGSLNENGTSKELSIINTSTASYGGNSTIRFINSATNNTIKYCTIKGSESRTDYGIIYFSSSDSGSGNSNNNIDNNDITNAGDRPVNAIYSIGTTGKNNSENIISNNNIYDFFKYATASRGISLNANTSTWTIDGNSFYETTAFAPTGTVTLEPIRIDNTSGNGFKISNNYIGGSAPQCEGTAWTKTNSNNNLFNAVYLNVGSSVASSVQNNTIKNINWSNSGIADWTGINVNSGSVNLGTVIGNVIGSTTSTNSISITGGSNGQKIKGIRMNGTGTINCFNNSIGSITGLTSTNFATNIYGIEVIATPVVTIENNTIGSSTTTNSIYASSASLSNQQLVYGIYARNHTEALNIHENIISNLNNNTSNTAVGTQGVINGIYTNAGTNIISENNISNLSIANANYSNTTPSIAGIYINIETDQPQTINNNTIHNLSNTYPSFTGLLSGLYFKRANGASNNTVNANFIHSLSVSGTSTGTKISGIYEDADNTTFSNNIITLDGGISTEVTGIYDGGTSGYSVNFFFNSIYVAGTNSGSEKSYCIRYNTANNTRDLRNNILFNARSGGTGSHYALYYDNTAGTFTSDYNDYFVSGTGGMLAYYNGNQTTLGDLQIATSQDTSSLNTNPNFTSAGGINTEDYITSAAMSGITGTGIVKDYDEITRNNPPKMGALEFSLSFVWQGNTNSDFGTALNWENGVVPPNGADILFATNPANDCILDINRTLKSITNSQSSKKLIVNGNQLTITGDLVFSNGAQIDASANASEIVFAGLAVQSIPSGAFVNNTINVLTVNNSHGLNQNGNITIEAQLTLTEGSLAIGENNTLTLNGDLTTTSGLLVGGSTSNISIGGSGTSTTLSSIIVNNFTLNRLNGISLSGDLTIEGTLTLTSGSLVVDSNTLTIVNTAPIQLLGNIDAGNSSATISFTNSVGMTLPTSLFSAAINNFTVNGGGITINEDITINGILNLESANQSTTAGLVHMGNFTMHMGATATNIGTGDVTGKIKRTTLLPNIEYTFGSPYTSVKFSDVGTLPTEVAVKVQLGTIPSWKTDGVKRIYDIIQVGAIETRAIVKSHYLDSELNGLTENQLGLFSYIIPTTTLIDRGLTEINTIDNWVSLSNANFENLASTYGVIEGGIGETVSDIITWDGSESSDWYTATNWTPANIPAPHITVIIPDATTTPIDPIILASSSSSINKIDIQVGGILNAGNSSNLEIVGTSGAWLNTGTFNAGTDSKVLFNSGNISEITTLSGTTNFYNIEVGANTILQPLSGATVRIAGAGTADATSVIDFSSINNTVEWNGTDQTIVNPNGIGGNGGYYNLILSGNGIKTMPNTALSIRGKFELEEEVTATADSQLTIGDEFEVINGATFNTGLFNHSVAGHFDVGGHGNTGTFNPEPGYSITLNGTTTQNIYGENTINFEKLVINNSSGIEMYTDIVVNDELTLTNGSLNVEETTLTLGGNLTKNTGFLNTIALSSLAFTNGITSTALSLPATLFETTPTIKDFTVSKTGGVTINSDIEVDGILSMLSANPSATKGSIDTGSFTIHMGESATTIGTGDVTGIIKRTTFLPDIEYTFGHQFTSVKFTDVGVLPTEISLKIELGIAPTWKTDGVKRIYDIIQVGANDTRAIVKFHYLDSELNGLTENQLGLFSYIFPTTTLIDRGLTEINTTDNWISLSNANFGNLVSTFGVIEGGIGETVSDIITWDGSESSDWYIATNWTPANVPAPHITVIIPDATTTPIDPIILASSSTSINKIDIQVGGILNAGNSSNLEIVGTSGAWLNTGTFNAGTDSKVLFNSGNISEIATLSGTTNFYNIEVGANSNLQPLSGATVRIAGAGTADATSAIDFSSADNTVEWNGVNQDIVNPNGIGGNGGYYNLILSGSGIKTIAPSISVTRIAGDFSISGTTTAIALDSLKITQNMTIGVGSTFQTGVLHHELAGNFENNGTFIDASGSTIIFNGDQSQTISGTATTSFDNLTIDKTLNNVTLSSSIDVNNKLLLNGGNLIIENSTLGINGTISNPSGALEVNTTSNLSFGGVSEITINNNLFNSTPSINNLTINQPGGVILGNQNITVNGLLDLSAGTLTVAENTLVIKGNSPTKTTGNIDVSNTTSTIEFANTSSISLPSNIFTGTINNFSVSDSGGVICNENISLLGVLNLDGGNTSLTKGSLDITAPFILDMGVDATTVGIGDVTGIVKREHIFSNGVEYSFGNQFTTMNFLDVPLNEKPKWIQCKITIGTAPTNWIDNNEIKIKRYYSFSQFQGDVDTPKGTDRMILRLHYLDSELNGLDESQLVYWDAYDPAFGVNNFVKSYARSYNERNTIDNWVQLNGPSINYISTSDQLDVKQWGLAYSYGIHLHTWTGNGSPSFDGDWSLPGNWQGGVPIEICPILIPHPDDLPDDNNDDPYPYRNLLPILTPARALTLEIAAGATLSVMDYDISIYGDTDAWVNNGTFIPGTSNVIFANGDPANIATIAGTTNFYNLTVNDKTSIQPLNGSVIGIENEINFTESSVLDFNTTNNTINYNGGVQTVITPNGGTQGYYNLSLSGNDVKTLPSATLELIGNLSIYESAIVTAENNITVGTNLNISDTSKLTIDPNIELTVNGTVSNLVGTAGLILSSSNIGTASLSHNTDNVPATVERYISGAAEDWHFLSSPISNQTMAGSNWLPSGTYGNDTGYDLYIWDEPTPCWIYQLNTTNAPNWPTKHPSSDFVPGRGYLYSVQELNPTNEFIGNLNNGTVSYPLTANNTEDLLLTGFNLIGNPYPSAIDWKASSGWTRSNLLDSGGGYDMWIWNPTANNYGVFNSSGTTGTNDVTQYIPSMQGFFVRAETNANIVMTNDIRSHMGTDYWMKSGKTQKEKSNLKVKIQSNSGLGYDEVLFQFGYSTNSAGATKLFSTKETAPSIYTTLENKKLSVKYLNDTINNPFVPVNFKPGNNGSYKLTIDIKVGNFNHLILEDKITKVFHDLLKEPEYIFKSSVKDNTDRFIIHFTPESSISRSNYLPIQMYYDGEYIVVDLSLISNDTEVVIFDLLGKQILNKNLEGKHVHRLSINSKKGVYIMVAKNLNKIMRKKIIVH